MVFAKSMSVKYYFECNFVSFLAVADNLRPNLNCYRNLTYPEPIYTPIYTPHLDALAKDSLLFSNAFVSQPFCGPSRAAILSSR